MKPSVIFLAVIFCGQHRWRHALLAGILFWAGVWCPPSVAETQDPDKMSLLLTEEDAFVYQREGRPDPFVPFIPEKLIQVEVAAEELTGMRRFEPGQLSLVSIVFTENGSLAMMEDSVGRGYIIREGSKIGRTGVVTKIASNQVVIKQKMLTTSGEERFQDVEMVLRKEGEK